MVGCLEKLNVTSGKLTTMWCPRVRAKKLWCIGALHWRLSGGNRVAISPQRCELIALVNCFSSRNDHHTHSPLFYPLSVCYTSHFAYDSIAVHRTVLLLLPSDGSLPLIRRLSAVHG
ncbi:hypothetical protein Q1695_003958 [Nippostrongylus brasiliensis]|nr:hypothetical protein Q1695_003958 [Nippostrongylus brasiliensis]